MGRGRVRVAGVAGVPLAPALAVGSRVRRDLLVQREPVGAGGDPGWRGWCRVAGGPSTVTTWAIWPVLGWGRLYCRHERQPFLWRSSLRGMPCSQGLRPDCCCVHSPRLRSLSRFTSASPRPGSNTSQRRARTARRPRRGPRRSRLDLRALLRMRAAWTPFGSRIQRLSRLDLHQRGLSIGIAVAALVSIAFPSTRIRTHARPPRLSESVLSACTAPTGPTWWVAAWMIWSGRPANSHPLKSSSYWRVRNERHRRTS